jgi:hypothetical protein
MQRTTIPFSNDPTLNNLYQSLSLLDEPYLEHFSSLHGCIDRLTSHFIDLENHGITQCQAQLRALDQLVKEAEALRILLEECMSTDSPSLLPTLHC